MSLARSTSAREGRDPLFSEAFTAILKSGGVECVRIPARSPNCNPHAERFVKTIKYEYLNHFIFFGERHLRHVLEEFMEHYLAERLLGGQLGNGRAGSASDKGTDAPIICRSRLGGLLNYYHRKAA